MCVCALTSQPPVASAHLLLREPGSGWSKTFACGTRNLSLEEELLAGSRDSPARPTPTPLRPPALCPRRGSPA